MAMMTEKQEVQMQMWLSRIRERQDSGLSIKDWCSKNQITETSYYYWLKKARRLAYLSAKEKNPPQVKEENAFIEVTLPAAPGPAVCPAPVGSPSQPREHILILRKGCLSVELREDIPTALLPPILAALADA